MISATVVALLTSLAATSPATTSSAATQVGATSRAALDSGAGPCAGHALELHAGAAILICRPRRVGPILQFDGVNGELYSVQHADVRHVERYDPERHGRWHWAGEEDLLTASDTVRVVGRAYRARPRPRVVSVAAPPPWHASLR